MHFLRGLHVIVNDWVKRGVTWLGGMTFKAVQFDTCIAVTRLAELTFGRNRDIFPRLILVGMATYALIQAELLGANTLVHGFITLMQQKLHVILSHHSRIRHTLVAIAAIDLEFWPNICRTQRPTQKE